jgi:hypothetical protein
MRQVDVTIVTVVKQNGGIRAAANKGLAEQQS